MHRILFARVIVPHPKQPKKGVLVVRKIPRQGERPGRFNLSGGRAGVFVTTDKNGKHTFRAETPHETGRRELHEETNIRLRKLTHLTTVRVSKRAAHGGLQHEQHHILVGHSPQKPRPNAEIREVAYYDPKNPSVKITAVAKKAINHYYRSLAKKRS